MQTHIKQGIVLTALSTDEFLSCYDLQKRILENNGRKRRMTAKEIRHFLPILWKRGILERRKRSGMQLFEYRLKLREIHGLSMMQTVRVELSLFDDNLRTEK